MASYTAGAYPALTHLVSTYLSNIVHYTIHPFLIYYEIVQPALNSPAEWFENHVLIEHPLTLSLHVLFAMIVYTLAMSTATGNHSSVDRLWSIVPFVYAWIFVVQSYPYFDARLTAIAAVTTIWGLRLTFNFARKGGYQNGHEDYRWPWLRALIKTPYGLCGDIVWHIFNVVFISGYQSVLLWAIVAPISMEAWNVRYRPLHMLNKDNAIFTPWNMVDTAALLLSLGCIALETIADNQQWAFQTEKYRQLAKAKEGSDRGVLGVSMSKPSVGLGATSMQAQELTKSKVQSNFQQKQKEAAPVVDVNQPEYLSKVEFPYSVGFPTTGLWKYSRHPNFFGEISLWFCLHLFAVASVYVSFTSSQKLNFPTPVSSGIALTQDWRSVLVFCRGATQILIVPVVRYSLAGAVNLWMLFNGSTALTEYLTVSKYPWYSVYQARTSRWMPFFSGGEITAADMKI